MLASDESREPDESLNLSLASDIVELVIFTTDDLFLQTLREAVGDARRLWHVPSPDKVSDLLLAGQVGILVLDVQSYSENPGVFVTRIKRQFPDLVVVVAGNREAETGLAKLISDGLVYRFLHKPVSPARAKLFADAAVKRYAERRKLVRPTPTAAKSLTADQRRLLIRIAIGLAGAALGLIAIWALRGRERSEAPAALSQPLPVDGEGVARSGPADSRELLLAQAENALLEERLDEAAAAIDAARKSGVDSARVAFLTTRLAKLRAELKSAARPKIEPPPDAGTGDGRLQQLLSLAAERIKEDRLIEPDRDSARFYVGEALGIDPNNNATQAAKETLARDLLAQTRGAIDHRDFAHARRLLSAADGIAAESNLENVRQLLAAEQKRADTDAWEGTLRTARERLQQDHLVEPPGDSAKDYLMTLRESNADNPDLAAALQELGSRLVGRARRALEAKQYDAARDWLKEADAVGFSSRDSTATERDLQRAIEQQSFLDNTIDATRLTLLKSVAPAYPVKAEKSRIQGWVELEFTVAASGDVQDIAVRAADPPGLFDKAAIGALSHWHYQPVLKDAEPTAQRARIRIRFALPD